MNQVNIFNELSELIMLRINSCSEIVHPNSWIESKQHQDYDLWCIQEGQIEIRIQDKVYLASEGDVMLFSPKLTYTATTLSKDCKFIFTHFDFGLGNQFEILDNFQLAGIIKKSLIEKDLRLFLETYEDYKRHLPMSGMRLKGSLTILIAKLLEHYHQGDYRGQFIYETKQPMNLDKLQPIFDFIHSHLHQPLRIGELAEVAGMSEKYFIAYFKKGLGVTPGRYISQLKMNRARELLYSRQYSVQQIASMLGYPDPYSFSKAFKKYYNVAPSKFVW